MLFSAFVFIFLKRSQRKRFKKGPVCTGRAWQFEEGMPGNIRIQMSFNHFQKH
jgi:hypothetical protein